MTVARVLNGAGLAQFRQYLEQLRGGSGTPPPNRILDDPALTTELPASVNVEPRMFGNRRELGKYLCEKLAPLPTEFLARNAGLWSWLSLYWIDQLCPARDDGTRRPGRDHRHIPEFDFRNRHLHLLYGPYVVYRRHGPASLVLLSGPVHEYSHIFQAITSRQDLIANRGVIKAALLLYVDTTNGALKHGCQPSQPRAGTLKRFVRVLQQLDLTYDIYGMSGRELLALLPSEFDAWRPAPPA